VHTVVVPPSIAGVGGGAGSSPEPVPPPVPDDAEPLEAEPDDPEHMPLVVGWHTKPSPQSASALQGKLHL
jgi:hypothetical protein